MHYIFFIRFKDAQGVDPNDPDFNEGYKEIGNRVEIHAMNANRIEIIMRFHADFFKNIMKDGFKFDIKACILNGLTNNMMLRYSYDSETDLFIKHD